MNLYLFTYFKLANTGPALKLACAAQNDMILKLVIAFFNFNT